MKKILILATMLLTYGFANGQKVYSVDYENQAGNNYGKWFFTRYSNQSKKKVYFVKYENQADSKIYFADYENQAGWRNSSKISLMY